MTKIIVVGSLALILSGCGAFDRIVANITGTSEVCYDGTVYLHFHSGVTPKIKNGSYVSCK